MQFPLAITSQSETGDRTAAVAVMAEADLGVLSVYGSPQFFFGKLLDFLDEQIPHLKSAQGVQAGFRGAEYRFEELEPSGTFKLVRSDAPR